jgi:hypothetical protein
LVKLAEYERGAVKPVSVTLEPNYGHADAISIESADLFYSAGLEGYPASNVFIARGIDLRALSTVSTGINNWMHVRRTDLPDGYIARYIGGRFRIVGSLS